MKTYKIETIDSIGVISNDQMVSILKEGYGLSRKLFNLYQLMLNNCEGLKKKAAEEDSDYQYFLLDLLGEIEEIEDPSNLIDFVNKLGAIQPSVGRRAAEAVFRFSNLMELIRPAIETYVPLLEKEEMLILEEVKDCIGNLATFIVYEYDFVAVKESIAKGDIELPLPVHILIDSLNNGITTESLINFIDFFIKIKEVCKPSLAFFDEYPELEEPFYTAVGPLAHDFDENEELLTLATVKSILTGKIDAGQIVDEFLEKKAYID